MKMKDLNFQLKSISKGKSVQLSSIDGWKMEDLPKILVVIEKATTSMKPLLRDDGTKTKSRDIETEIKTYYSYHLTKDNADLFVRWPGVPSLEEVTATNWKENPEFLDHIREIAKEANKTSSSPIKLVAGKNQDLCRIHYVCHNHTVLPMLPPELNNRIKNMIDPIVGAKIRLWKDHSDNWGKVGYLDEEMLHWEDRERKKESGLLHVYYPDGRVGEYPDFTGGRQDFWTGMALEMILDDLNEELNRTPGGSIGTDFTIADLSDDSIVGNLTRDELKRIAKKLGKHFLLRNLHERYGVESQDSDFSTGSTVTWSGLSRLAIAMAKAQREELGDGKRTWGVSGVGPPTRNRWPVLTDALQPVYTFSGNRLQRASVGQFHHLLDG